MAILSLFVALLDGTATALSVGLDDEGKPQPFYRWLLSSLEDGEKRRETARNGDIFLYLWLSETIYTGDCCG
ncbi:hypothetical protein DY000_02020861 [Brassica cretica]|uniref:Uncharacterized protein n=1 Tax=Brassica cretica TaxID=69181 RepID=A0ABQ7EB10_BRACR|nr:hypothetical protein DY000_02020861 [Brassica cretica]